MVRLGRALGNSAQRTSPLPAPGRTRAEGERRGADGLCAPPSFSFLEGGSYFPRGGMRSTCPGKILSGSLSIGRFASKIAGYFMASP